MAIAAITCSSVNTPPPPKKNLVPNFNKIGSQISTNQVPITPCDILVDCEHDRGRQTAEANDSDADGRSEREMLRKITSGAKKKKAQHPRKARDSWV